MAFIGQITSKVCLGFNQCFRSPGTSSPSTPDARLLSSIAPPDQRGPILRRVVKMKLYKDASCEQAFDLEDLAITMLVNTRFKLNFRCFCFNSMPKSFTVYFKTKYLFRIRSIMLNYDCKHKWWWEIAYWSLCWVKSKFLFIWENFVRWNDFFTTLIQRFLSAEINCIYGE